MSELLRLRARVLLGDDGFCRDVVLVDDAEQVVARLDGVKRVNVEHRVTERPLLVMELRNPAFQVRSS